MVIANVDGICVHTEDVGPMTVEIYRQEDTYFVFVVGEEVASFLGSSQSFEDCLEEIKCLKSLAESDLFQQAVSDLS